MTAREIIFERVGIGNRDPPLIGPALSTSLTLIPSNCQSPLCESASRVKLILGLSSTSKVEDPSGPHASAQHTATELRFH